jgi:hypothetical protein
MPSDNIACSGMASFGQNGSTTQDARSCVPGREAGALFRGASRRSAFTIFGGVPEELLKTAFYAIIQRLIINFPAQRNREVSAAIRELLLPEQGCAVARAGKRFCWDSEVGKSALFSLAWTTSRTFRRSPSGPTPRRLTTLEGARDYIREALRHPARGGRRVTTANAKG